MFHPDNEDIRQYLDRIAELEDAKEALTQELDATRIQCDNALLLASGINQIQEENLQLQSKIRAVNSERDDFEHRNEILRQKNEDLNAKLDKIKKQSYLQQEDSYKQVVEEISKVKEDCQAQIDSVLTELEKSQSAKEQVEIEHKALLNRIDRLLNSAQNAFQVEIHTLEELSSVLDSSTYNSPEYDIPQQQSQPDVSKLQRKFKRACNKLRESNRRIDDLTSENKCKQAEISNLQQSSQAQIDSLNKRISDLQSAYNNEKESNKKTITSLNQQIDRLKFDLQQKSKELAQKAQCYDISATPSKQQLQLANFESGSPKEKCDLEASPIEKSNQYIEKVTTLQEQLSASQQRYEELHSKLEEVIEENQKLQSQNQQTITELNSLQKVHQNALSEISSLREILHSPPPPPPEKTEDEKPKQPASNPLLDRAKQTITDLQKELSIAKSAIVEKDRQIENLTNENKFIEQKYQNDHEALIDLQVKCETDRPLTFEEQLPTEVWATTVVPSSVSNDIKKIASNTALQPSTKLQTSFKLIASFFTKEINARDNEIEQILAENQELTDSVNQFLIDLSIALDDQPINFESFCTENGGAVIVEKAIEMRSKLESTERELENLRTLNMSLSNEFKGMPISEIKQQIEQQDKLFLKMEKKAKRYKSALAKVSNQTKSEIESMQSELNGLRRENEDLKSENDHLSESVKKFKSDNQRLMNELRVSEDVRADQEMELRNAIDAELARSEVEKSAFEDSFRGEIDRVQMEKEQLQAQVEDSERQIDRLKKIILHQKEVEKQRQEEIDGAYILMKKNKEESTARAEQEKNQLRETYENAMSQLSEQCEQQRGDLKKLATELASSRVEVNSLKESLENLKREKTRLEVEIGSMKRQQIREQKISESRAKTEEVNRQMKERKLLEEKEREHEMIQRRLIAAGIEQFKNFFNASEQINERSYKSTLEKARKELDRLAKSDQTIREMVDAKDGQTTTDAVAQLLLPSFL